MMEAESGTGSWPLHYPMEAATHRRERERKESGKRQWHCNASDR